MNQRKQMAFVTEQFRQKIKTGPEYACSVCHRTLFKNQVVKCLKDEYLKRPNIIAVAQKCIRDTHLH